ncbi:MAG: 2-succinyl-6-hydroxy-2,4-cyclohexadiene-1-carboxylate synthase, partial [Chloroflexi bacterium CFX6]|nr:2-succinyl-6-hydroxy-2,4-cyclohexadiene-1-carboxylate synthase [Chloroflexi bacterium CFX6]
AVTDRLAGLAVPTLVVAGAEDGKFCAIAAAMAARIPGARTAIVPGVGHAVHVEAPAALADVVEAFLADVDPV